MRTCRLFAKQLRGDTSFMFAIVIPVLNQHDDAVKHLDSWFRLAKGQLHVVFIDNGSDQPFSEHPSVARWGNQGHNNDVLTNSENIGVYPTFQQGYDYLIKDLDWIFYSHSDVEMLDLGWDERMVKILKFIQVIEYVFHIHEES